VLSTPPVPFDVENRFLDWHTEAARLAVAVFLGVVHNEVAFQTMAFDCIASLENLHGFLE
jgi:hypothetical protein